MSSKKYLSKWFRPESIFYTIFLASTALLFINGLNSFISSSEFWSIYLSQKLFSWQLTWSSVYLKPAFHLVLAVIYLFKLNDFYHIYVAKILFSLNGVFQFFLIYKIFISLFRSRIICLLQTLFLFLSPVFLANYYRIRSDQMALTLFLLFIVVSISNWPFKKWLQLFIFFLFPAIAMKHLYFSALSLFFLPLRNYWEIFQKQNLLRKTLIALALMNLFLWGLYAAKEPLHYFLETYNSELSHLVQLKLWIKADFPYLILSFFPYLVTGFRRFMSKNNLTCFFFSQCLIIFIIFIHPQKLPFFLASLTLVLYFPAAFFLQYLMELKFVNKMLLALTITLVTVCNLQFAKKYFHLFTLNNPQLITIERLSNIITDKDLTYLDGMGLLPRAKNIGCFVSPDDETSNKFCLDSLRNRTPDAIILTNRLLGLPFDFFSLEKNGYKIIGPNLFIRKELVESFKNEVTEWPAPSIIFSFDQLY